MASLLTLPNLPATSLCLLLGSPTAIRELILFAGNDLAHPVQPMIQIAPSDIMRWLAILLLYQTAIGSILIYAIKTSTAFSPCPS